MNQLDKNYQNLLQDILSNGVKKEDRTGTGTISVFGRQIRHNMRDGFPLLTTKKMAWRSMLVELLWFLRGDTNIKFLVDNNCNIWNGDAYKTYRESRVNDKHAYTMEEFVEQIKVNPAFADKYGELGPIYGKQWRQWRGPDGYDWNTKVSETSIDQIANLINDLKTNPDSRRLMVSAWNVGEIQDMVLPPCHYGFQLYTRELSWGERSDIYYKKYPVGTDDIKSDKYYDELHIPTRAISLMWNQRSVDTFLGLPFNIASYGLLLEIIAKEVNMVPDQLIGNLGDTHLYSNHIEQAKEQINRDSFQLPTLNINTEFWQTETGECGVGPLNTNLQGFEVDDFTLKNYQSHPTIKAPLSN